MNQIKFDHDFEKYMQTKRDDMLNRYNRVLPSGELIFNRFDKSKYLGFGKGSSIYDTSVVMGNVEVGENTWIGPYTLLEGYNAKLTIGNFVSIDAGVMIYTHDSTDYYISGGKADFKKGEVTINDNVVIGTMSMIGYGVTIGKHSIIAAHSFVNENVPEYSIVAGVPAKIIGTIEIDNVGNVIKHYNS